MKASSLYITYRQALRLTNVLQTPFRPECCKHSKKCLGAAINKAAEACVKRRSKGVSDVQLQPRDCFERMLLAAPSCE